MPWGREGGGGEACGVFKKESGWLGNNCRLTPRLPQDKLGSSNGGRKQLTAGFPPHREGGVGEGKPCAPFRGAVTGTPSPLRSGAVGRRGGRRHGWGWGEDGGKGENGMGHKRRGGWFRFQTAPPPMRSDINESYRFLGCHQNRRVFYYVCIIFDILRNQLLANIFSLGIFLLCSACPTPLKFSFRELHKHDEHRTLCHSHPKGWGGKRWRANALGGYH